jgi:hypothetical protein
VLLRKPNRWCIRKMNVMEMTAACIVQINI